MRRLRWMPLMTTLAALLPAGVAAQLRPTGELHGSLWDGPSATAAGFGVFLGASGTGVSAGVAADWVPGSDTRENVFALEAQGGPRVTASDVVRLGFDLRAGALRTDGEALYTAGCPEDVLCLSAPATAPGRWSALGGVDASLELGRAPGPSFAVRYGFARLFGGADDGRGLSRILLGVRYRLR